MNMNVRSVPKTVVVVACNFDIGPPTLADNTALLLNSEISVEPVTVQLCFSGA